MRSAREVLCEAVLKTSKNVTAAYIIKESIINSDHKLCLRLMYGHTSKEMLAFINSIDESYDDCFGNESWNGMVWLSDESWLEFNGIGSELPTTNWMHFSRPAIPGFLFDNRAYSPIGRAIQDN
jgi:hypothetical protein